MCFLSPISTLLNPYETLGAFLPGLLTPTPRHFNHPNVRLIFLQHLLIVRIWSIGEETEEGPAERVYITYPVLATAGTSGNLKDWRSGIVTGRWLIQVPRWTQKMSNAFPYSTSAMLWVYWITLSASTSSKTDIPTKIMFMALMFNKCMSMLFNHRL